MMAHRIQEKIVGGNGMPGAFHYGWLYIYYASPTNPSDECLVNNGGETGYALDGDSGSVQGCALNINL